jgi:hypothetical protein
MSDILVNGKSFRQQFRKCGAACKHGPGGQGHGPYWYSFEAGSSSHYIGRELPPAVAAHLDLLTDDRKRLEKLRGELAGDVVNAETALQHARGLLRALDNLMLGRHLDRAGLVELELDKYLEVLKAL